MSPETLSDVHTDPLELWCAYPDDLLDAALAADCAALLTPEEQAHWQRFRFERNRREFLATRALVRTVLSRHRPLAPGAWRFRANAHGKPETEPPCGVSFNLSNALGMVVCLIAQSTDVRIDVGVDVEPIARAPEIVPLAPDVFSPREQAQLHALPAADRPDRALSLWTLKESYIKARGMGLALPLARFSFVFGEEGEIRLEVDPALGDDAGRWRFRMLDHAGHRIALMAAVEGEPALEFWELRFTGVPASRIPAPAGPWWGGRIGR